MTKEQITSTVLGAPYGKMCKPCDWLRCARYLHSLNKELTPPHQNNAAGDCGPKFETSPSLCKH
jgi:hypothetical protein